MGIFNFCSFPGSFLNWQQLIVVVVVGCVIEYITVKLIKCGERVFVKVRRKMYSQRTFIILFHLAALLVFTCADRSGSQSGIYLPFNDLAN